MRRSPVANTVFSSRFSSSFPLTDARLPCRPPRRSLLAVRDRPATLRPAPGLAVSALRHGRRNGTPDIVRQHPNRDAPAPNKLALPPRISARCSARPPSPLSASLHEMSGVTTVRLFLSCLRCSVPRCTTRTSTVVWQTLHQARPAASLVAPSDDRAPPGNKRSGGGATLHRLPNSPSASIGIVRLTGRDPYR
ncbi:hypothetical protein OH77DRAFT_1016841 [Trametes cingulata]|nr:hypothetical protein OH77DRAFT_1016841 [Trametes cingulata]